MDKKYDLEERTAEFGENILDFCKSLKQDSITRPLISQLVRSGTSVGANYSEGNEATSKKDFQHKLSIAKKEARETMHWLRMINRVDESNVGKTKELKQEAHELVLIFSAIIRK